MWRFIFIGAIVLSGTSAFSQKHFIGLRTGIGFTNAKNKVFEDSDMQRGLTAGLTYDYFLTDNFSLGGEIAFIQRGFSDDFYVRDGQNQNTEKTIFKLHYSYIAIPLKISYSGNTKFYGFASGGLIPAFIVDASHDVPTVAGFVGGNVKVTTVSAFDIAGMLEVGGGYKISGRYQVFVSMSGQFSLTKFTNDNYFTTADGYHYGFALSTGLKYAVLGKK